MDWWKRWLDGLVEATAGWIGRSDVSTGLVAAMSRGVGTGGGIPRVYLGVHAALSSVEFGAVLWRREESDTIVAGDHPTDGFDDTVAVALIHVGMGG